MPSGSGAQICLRDWKLGLCSTLAIVAAPVVQTHLLGYVVLVLVVVLCDAARIGVEHSEKGSGSECVPVSMLRSNSSWF